MAAKKAPPVVLIREVLPSTGDRAWIVQREGKSGHVVEWGPFEVWHCDCTAHHFGKRCAHIDAVREKVATNDP